MEMRLHVRFFNARFRLAMQDDDNLLIYPSDGRPLIWDTGTWNDAGAWLAVQDHRNLVIDDANGTAIWASNTPRCETA